MVFASNFCAPLKGGKIVPLKEKSYNLSDSGDNVTHLAKMT